MKTRRISIAHARVDHHNVQLQWSMDSKPPIPKPVSDDQVQELAQLFSSSAVHGDKKKFHNACRRLSELMPDEIKDELGRDADMGRRRPLDLIVRDVGLSQLPWEAVVVKRDRLRSIRLDDAYCVLRRIEGGVPQGAPPTAGYALFYDETMEGACRFAREVGTPADPAQVAPVVIPLENAAGDRCAAEFASSGIVHIAGYGDNGLAKDTFKIHRAQPHPDGREAMPPLIAARDVCGGGHGSVFGDPRLSRTPAVVFADCCHSGETCLTCCGQVGSLASAVIRRGTRLFVGNIGEVPTFPAGVGGEDVRGSECFYHLWCALFDNAGENGGAAPGGFHAIGDCIYAARMLTAADNLPAAYSCVVYAAEGVSPGQSLEDLLGLDVPKNVRIGGEERLAIAHAMEGMGKPAWWQTALDYALAPAALLLAVLLVVLFRPQAWVDATGRDAGNWIIGMLAVAAGLAVSVIRDVGRGGRGG
ncbi:MAG: hypothetical protein LBT74_05885 [Acidobacteriota bacterium]|jgi:hypothetical protein|nr:hypothetical protein [Acidobacteriota bacterium]